MRDILASGTRRGGLAEEAEHRAARWDALRVVVVHLGAAVEFWQRRGDALVEMAEVGFTTRTVPGVDEWYETRRVVGCADVEIHWSVLEGQAAVAYGFAGLYRRELDRLVAEICERVSRDKVSGGCGA